MTDHETRRSIIMLTQERNAIHEQVGQMAADRAYWQKVANNVNRSLQATVKDRDILKAQVEKLQAALEEEKGWTDKALEWRDGWRTMCSNVAAEKDQLEQSLWEAHSLIEDLQMTLAEHERNAISHENALEDLQQANEERNSLKDQLHELQTKLERHQDVSGLYSRPCDCCGEAVGHDFSDNLCYRCLNDLSSYVIETRTAERDKARKALEGLRLEFLRVSRDLHEYLAEQD